MRPFKTILRKRIWILLEKASYKTKKKKKSLNKLRKDSPGNLKGSSANFNLLTTNSICEKQAHQQNWKTYIRYNGNSEI